MHRFLIKITKASLGVISACLLSGGVHASDPPANIPVSTSAPGGLAPADTPQLILITFDDAVNSTNYDDILKILDHQNADGSPIAMTFYISVDISDYYLIHKLHAAGQEIAAHTMTHTTGNSQENNTSFDTWVREIEGCREALTRYAGIPREQITGFRAPYLAYNADMWKALALLGFSYDTSVPETPDGLNSPDEAHYIWPYTLHDGLKQYAWTGEPPAENYPNLLEIPMWTLTDENTVNGYHNMDPDVATEAEMLAVLKNNFTTRYEGNRIPVGIYFHKGWLTEDKNINAMNDFLEWALAKEDVFVVGVGALDKWMRNPVSADTAVSQGLFTVQTYTPVPENEVILNVLSPNNFRSVHHPATLYPAPDNAFQKRVVVAEPITFRVEETVRWGGTAYQAEIYATNTGSHTVSDWEIEFDAGNNVMGEMWNGAYTQSGNTITVTPKHVIDIPPGEEIMVSNFGAEGDPGTFGDLSPTFWETGPRSSPQLSLAPGSSGNMLQWNRAAPMYELQGRDSLLSGDWQSVKMLYGAEETEVEPESPYLFYRLHCIH